MDTKIRKIFIGIITLLCILVISTTNSNAISYTNLELDGNWVSTSVTSTSNPEYYSFTVPSDGTVTLTYQGFASSIYFGVYSYDMDEEFSKKWVAGGSDISPATKTEVLNLSKGTYCIKIWAERKDSGGDVRVKATYKSGKVTDKESNNSFSEAMFLTKGVTEKAMLTATDDVDFFKIKINKKGPVSIKVKHMFHAYFTLYTSDYEELDKMWLSGGSENSPETHEYSETLDKGIYYIKITEYERGTGGYYISYTDSQISSISLNKTFLKLSEGQKIQLNATIKPKDAVNKTLEWSSSNEDIVGVWKDGWIKAKQAGKSTIYVKATDGSKKEAICTVVVIPNKVSKVYLNSDKTTSSTIGIDWNSSYNADGYRVMLYDKNKKKFVKYRDTSKTSMTIKGLTAETKYRVKVIPYIKDGSKKVFGEESSVYKVYTAPKKLKAPVIKSKTKVGEYSTYTTVYTTVKLKWSKVSGATGYYIYRSYDGGKYEKLNGLITKTSCYVYVINGKTARYKVVAYRTKNDLTTNGKASKTVKYRAK